MKRVGEQEGIIFKIERFRLDDGPGIRTTIFVKGCPLRCLWCSNPEGQNPYPEKVYNESLCIKGCEECIRVCPTNAISRNTEGKIVFNMDRCIRCYRCLEVCHAQSLIKVGERVTVEKVLKEVKKDVLFYQETGGGITVSGGEPLTNPGFTQELLKSCKKRGIHTVLDTSGYGEIEGVLKYTDLVLYDIKHIDPIEHQKYTGVTNEIILENAKRISQKNVPMIIRVPIIPGVNNSRENINKLIEFLKELRLIRVELLPYHRLGVDKYKMIGKRYELKSLKLPTKDDLNLIKELFKIHNINCKILI